MSGSYFLLNHNIYRLNELEMYENDTFTFNYIFINLPIWTTFYSFSGLLSIYMTYERIQIVMNRKSIISRTSVSLILNPIVFW